MQSEEDQASLRADSGGEEKERRQLVRKLKNVMVRSDESVSMDPAFISPRFYNSFNYSLLEGGALGATIGVTSGRAGEGKTVVAANIALSLALAEERETLLLDLNTRRPSVHSIFGVSTSPGLTEAVLGSTVHVCRTAVDRLFLLTSGNPGLLAFGFDHSGNGYSGNGHSRGHNGNGRVRPATVAPPSAFKDIMYSLQQRFEIIVVDMPPVLDGGLPMVMTQHVQGLVLVIDSTRTTKNDVGKILRLLGKNRAMGLVLNRVNE